MNAYGFSHPLIVPLHMVEQLSVRVSKSNGPTGLSALVAIHQKLIGTSDYETDSDEEANRKLRLCDGLSIQDSTFLAARREARKKPLSEDNIKCWKKALPQQGAKTSQHLRTFSR